MIPLVSIVIPTYNQPRYLIEAMAGVFAQTFTDFELIIVDDGSTDDTPAALEAARNRGWPFTLIRQDNAGVGAARDRGIAAARGKYVALLDHDDLWHPEKLAIQTAFYQHHHQCAMVLVPWAYMNADATQRQSVPFRLYPHEIQSGIIERPLRHRANSNVFLMSSAMMFDRARAAGLTHGRLRQCIEDSQFHIGLFCRGPVGIAGWPPGLLHREQVQPLMWYRSHPRNTSTESLYFDNGLRHLRRMDRDEAFADIGENRPDLEAFFAALARHAAAQQLVAGRRSAAWNAYFRELPGQIKDRRLKFALSFPLLASMPHRLAKKLLHAQ